MASLSICIPVYNQNVSLLLEDLLQQCKELKEKVEILVFEDGSAERMTQYNEWLRNEKNVIYQAFRKNVGRAAIRNKLGQAASGDYLLFLDDDSRFEDPEFLKNYLKNASPDSVLCGGRDYPSAPPGDQFTLHWKYGRQRESRDASERNEYPHDSFHSNNFLIPRPVFMKHPFDANLTQYGHEDTLFGYELYKNNIPVRHIHNPVIHSELETNLEFLEKTRLAIQNLWALYQRKDQGFNKSVKLLRVYGRLKKLGLTFPLAMLFRIAAFNLEQYLLYADSPSLRTFNMYKLGYLATLKYSNKVSAELAG